MSFPGWFSQIVDWSGITASVTLGNSSALHDGRADRKATLASGSSMSLTFDFGAAKTLSGVALVNISQLLSATTVAVAASTNNFSSQTAIKAASPIDITGPHAGDAVVVFAPASFRYWRVTIAFASPQTLTLGEILWTGAVSVMSRRDAYGVGYTYTTPQSRNEIGNGAVYTTQLGEALKTRRVALRVMRGETERDELHALWAYSRGLRPVLWCEDASSNGASADATTESRRCIFGLATPAFGWSEADFRLYDFDEFTIQEFGR